MLIIRIDFKVYNALIPYTLEELEETKGLSTILSAKEQGKLPFSVAFFVTPALQQKGQRDIQRRQEMDAGISAHLLPFCGECDAFCYIRTSCYIRISQHIDIS